MRWILVFIFLYLIPLIALFKNYKNIKRSFIYSSIYVVLATTIVVSNVYISGINKIEEALYYQNYANEDRYRETRDLDENVSNKEENISDIIKENKDMEVDIDTEVNKYENEQVDIDKNKDITEEAMTIEDDMEVILNFKNDIYEIEKIALIPMRDCMPYTKNIAENLKKLSEIKSDIEYAKKKCIEVVAKYDNMEIPALSKKQYTSVLDSARDDLKKTYELREKAMESAINLIDTKNPKYIGQITEYLKLSDNNIASFKDRISDLKMLINNNEIEKN